LISSLLRGIIWTVSLDRSNLTRLLREGAAGDRAAFDQVMRLVYDELRRIARHQMSGQRPGHTLQPTEMVHAAYLRLVSRSQSETGCTSSVWPLP
jgi:DNA-directed RNA polymerase specialized sigma24 family protein